MSEINRVNQIMLQLRAQLQQVGKGKSTRTHKSSKAEPGPIERLRHRREPADQDNPETRQTFVRAILLEELGEDLAGQPEFDAIIARVFELMESDPTIRDQLSKAIQLVLKS